MLIKHFPLDFFAKIWYNTNQLARKLTHTARRRKIHARRPSQTHSHLLKNRCGFILMKIINNHSSLINIKCPSSFLPRHSLLSFSPSTLSTVPHSTRQQRPIIICPFLMLIFVFFPLHPCLGASTSVENILQIGPFYAKQTQFAKTQNKRKLIYSKGLRK